MPRPVAPDSRSFVVVLLLTVSAAVAGTVEAAVALGQAGAPKAVVIALALLAVGALVGAAFAVRGYAALRRELVARVRGEAAARADALTDELTGAYNRRGFRTLADHQLRVARRNGGDVLLLCADVNAFKAINDRYGHASGDAALREVAALLRRTVRDTDVVGRLGGDEFAVLVVDAGPEAERAVLARLEQGLAAHNARLDRGEPLSLSIGTARLLAHPGAGLDDLLRVADDALYRDKGARRSRPTPARGVRPRASAA